MLRVDLRRPLLAAALVLLFPAPAGGALAGDETTAADLLYLYTRARELDPAFRAAALERQIAAQGVRESRSQLLPVVNATVEATKSYQDIRSSDSFLFTEGQTDFVSDTFAISLTQPVYRLEALARLPQARARERQAEATLIAAEQDLIVRIAEAHFEYLAALDEVDRASAERMALRRLLQETEQRLGSGLATLTDVHEARARFAVAQATETDARDQLEDARQALAEIVGLPPADVKTLSETFPLVEPDRPDVESWVETALFQNPAIKAREAVIEVARQELRGQRAARLPRLDLVTSFANRDSGGTTFGDPGGTEIATTEIALRLGIPLYDGGRASASTRTALLRQRIAIEELEREKRRTERATRAAFQGVRSGIVRVGALQQSVFSHEAALSRKEQGLRSGLNTGLDVLDARRELFRARRDLTRARYAYVLSSLKLKQATGILDVDDLRQINAYLQ